MTDITEALALALASTEAQLNGHPPLKNLDDCVNPERYRALAKGSLEVLEPRSTWTDWNGGTKPPADTQTALGALQRVQIKCRDGAVEVGRVNDFVWSHEGPEVQDGDGDIIAYRVLDELTYRFLGENKDLG